MDTNPHVSIIMSVTNRPRNFLNTLKAWYGINYPKKYYDVSIIANGAVDNFVRDYVDFFSVLMPISLYYEPASNLNVIWNKYGKQSIGDYVVFAMMDEIISHRDILQHMVNVKNRRSSIFTYFMDEEQTKNTVVDGKWFDGTPYRGKPYTDQTNAALLSHITGNYRRNWEWFGWFRDNPTGRWWIDQDVYLREKCLSDITNTPFWAVTPKGVYCLHQYHSVIENEDSELGYIYVTKEQALLKDPAPRG